MAILLLCARSMIMVEDVREAPSLLYGTAWKEEKTAGLTLAALRAGFRAIDTANQKKHYREDFVGEALVHARDEGVVRDALFLQSKFTFAESQDHRLPYDPSASYDTQVRSSFSSTLENLQTDYLDAFLLHGPVERYRLTDVDREAWSAIEDLHREGSARRIGISNVSHGQLVELLESAEIRPHIVQNRCYARLRWDREVRECCAEHGIAYQGFSLLTANRYVVQSEEVRAIGRRLKATPAQVVLRFAQQIGICVLTGTTSTRHMIDDLQIGELELTLDDLAIIAALPFEG